MRLTARPKNLTGQHAADAFIAQAFQLLNDAKPGTEARRFEDVAVDAAHLLPLDEDTLAELAGAAMVVRAEITEAPVQLRRWLETLTAEDLIALTAEVFTAGAGGYLGAHAYLRNLPLEYVGNDVRRVR